MVIEITKNGNIKEPKLFTDEQLQTPKDNNKDIFKNIKNKYKDSIINIFILEKNSKPWDRKNFEGNEVKAMIHFLKADGVNAGKVVNVR